MVNHRNRLGMQTAPGADSHVEDTGYVLGLMFRHPMLNRIEGWARAGAIYSHMEVVCCAGHRAVLTRSEGNRSGQRHGNDRFDYARVDPAAVCCRVFAIARHRAHALAAVCRRL